MRGTLSLHRVGSIAAVALLALLAAGCRESPTEPPVSQNTLTGSWRGATDKGPCGQGWSEDWSTVILTLVQTGSTVSGEIYAPQGRHFPISSTDATLLGVGGLEGTSTCYAYGFFITDRTFDADGTLRRFSGTTGGRCCGTVAGFFAFDRR